LKDLEINDAFLVPVPNRTAETMMDVLDEHVAKGSILITDLWKSYNAIDPDVYQHQTVNHSQFWKDPISDSHTNTIEGA